MERQFITPEQVEAASKLAPDHEYHAIPKNGAFIGTPMRLVSEIDGTAVISTTELAKRLGMPINSTFLKRIGLTPYVELNHGVYWLHADVPSIRTEICQYLEGLAL